MQKAGIYSRYPLSSIILYESITIVHFVLGGIGIFQGYGFSWLGYLFGSLYLAFAFVQMYVIMPLKVCPNCVYYGMKNAICVSGLNLISRKMAKKGDLRDFAQRSEGPFCHNNLYMAALIMPIVAIIPALVMNFSLGLLAILIVLVTLLLLRIFVVFKIIIYN